jgi:hypothetical protein
MIDAMVTAEEHSDGTTVVTILDDAGRDADIEVHFKPGGPNVTIRQLDINTGGSDVVILTPLQAVFLRELLNNIMQTEEPNSASAH